jgi:hypothetical protein
MKFDPQVLDVAIHKKVQLSDFSLSTFSKKRDSHSSDQIHSIGNALHAKL